MVCVMNVDTNTKILTNPTFFIDKYLPLTTVEGKMHLGNENKNVFCFALHSVFITFAMKTEKLHKKART